MPQFTPFVWCLIALAAFTVIAGAARVFGFIAWPWGWILAPMLAAAAVFVFGWVVVLLYMATDPL